MDNAKIVKVLGNNHYEIKVTPIKRNDPIVVGVAHDYALFSNNSHLFTEYPLTIPSETGRGSSNILPIRSTVQIPINAMGSVIMPYLNGHPHLNSDHYSKYCLDQLSVKMWSDSKTIHVYDQHTNSFVEMSQVLHDQLTGKNE